MIGGLLFSGRAMTLVGDIISEAKLANAIVVEMLEFCARHDIAPQVERFPMSRANDALERLRNGKPRYRIVLDNDFR